MSHATYSFILSDVKKSLDILRNKSLKKMDPWNCGSLALQGEKRRSTMQKKNQGSTQESWRMTVLVSLGKSLGLSHWLLELQN